MNPSIHSVRPVIFAAGALALAALLPDSAPAGQPRDNEIRFTCAQLVRLGEPLGACAIPARNGARVALESDEPARTPVRHPRG